MMMFEFHEPVNRPARRLWPAAPGIRRHIGCPGSKVKTVRQATPTITPIPIESRFHNREQPAQNEEREQANIKQHDHGSMSLNKPKSKTKSHRLNSTS
jgi:hypothetical protein